MATLPEPMTPKKIKRSQLIAAWSRASSRLVDSRTRIHICREIQRHRLVISPPADWLTDNKEAALTCVSILPEREQIVDNMVAMIGTDEAPYAERKPLGGTEQAEEDADHFEEYCDSVRETRVNSEEIRRLIVEGGELGWVAVPRLDCLWGWATMTYQEECEVKGEDGTVTKGRRPRSEYDRDAQGRAIDDDPKLNGEQNATRRRDKRDEKKSREAYDDAYLSFLANNPPDAVRLIHPLDCAPVLVPGLGSKTYECRALFIRTLVEPEYAINDCGLRWKNMGDPDYGHAKQNKGLGPTWIPRAWNTENDSTAPQGTLPMESSWGAGNQMYLYEMYAVLDRHIVGAWCMGGSPTWFEGNPAPAEDDEDSVAIIDFTEEYGITEPIWGYEHGQASADDPNWRSKPWLWRFVQSILGIEELETSINVANRENAFTGHVTVPAEHIPKEGWFNRGKNLLRMFKKPPPGKVAVMPGPVEPFRKAEVGGDAWKELQYRRQMLTDSIPVDPSKGANSGRQQVVTQQIQRNAQRQMRNAELAVTGGIVRALIVIRQALANRPQKDKRLPPIPVWVTTDETLAEGTSRPQYRVLQLNDRWVGKNPHVKFVWPEEGNLAEVEEAMSLVERGILTDEDVYEKLGKRSTMAMRVRRAVYDELKSPEGQLELRMRAAKERGDKERYERLKAVLAGQVAPDGTPMAAIQGDPQAEMMAKMALPQPGESRPAGPTARPNPVQQSRAGTIGADMESAAVRGDAVATAQV